MIDTTKDKAIAWLECLREHALQHPSLYDFPDFGVGTNLAICSYILHQGQTITNDQTHGIQLLQTINRLLEEA